MRLARLVVLLRSAKEGLRGFVFVFDHLGFSLQCVERPFGATWEEVITAQKTLEHVCFQRICVSYEAIAARPHGGT